MKFFELMREQKELSICQQAEYVANSLLNADPYTEEQKNHVI